MSRYVAFMMLTIGLAFLLAACSGGGTHAPSDIDDDFPDNDTSDVDLADGDSGDTDTSEAEGTDGDVMDNDVTDADWTDNDTADGGEDTDADTDVDASDEDSETTQSSTAPIFSGFSAASGRMTNGRVQLTFSFAPAALATPTVSGNGSVRLLSSVTPLSR